MRRKGGTRVNTNNRAVLGDHNAISDLSGFKFKASEMRLMEGIDKNLLVHFSEWNPENPQLHIRGRSDDTSVTNARPRTTDIFDTNASGDYLLQNEDNLEFNMAVPNEASFN
jgi:hypothetical protein